MRPKDGCNVTGWGGNAAVERYPKNDVLESVRIYVKVHLWKREGRGASKKVNSMFSKIHY